MTELEKAEQGLPFVYGSCRYRMTIRKTCSECAFINKAKADEQCCIRNDLHIGDFCLYHEGAWEQCGFEDN